MNRLTTITTFLICALAAHLPAQCFMDQHNCTWFDGWISCDQQASPNPARDNGHWIMYDFGQQYELFEMHVWNTNAPDHLDYGLQNVVIDISADGINWAEFGQYVFPQGTGDMRYEGTEVMHFDSANARYVLITAIDNYGGSCYGLSEIRIRAHSLCLDDKQVWIAGDGDWNIAANWCSNRVPDEHDKVVIPSNVTVTIPFLYTAHVWTIDLDPDAELNMVGSMIVHKQD